MKHPIAGHKTVIAVLTGWLILGTLFVVYSAQSQRALIGATLHQESVVLHRLISQRADQHDAHLTSLSALAQAGDPPHADLFLQVAAAIQRFYPRVHAIDLVSLSGEAAPITTRHDDVLQAAGLATIRRAAQSSSGELVLTASPLAADRYLIVKRSPNSDQARFGLALEIDARLLIKTEAPFWQTPGASTTLAMPDGSVLAEYRPEPGSASSDFRAPLTVHKTLGSRTQPLILTTQRAPQIRELLPAKQLFIGLSALASILIVSALVIRLISRTRSAERRARFGEQDARIAHASRVNAMGELASGMAHELTQPLTAILSQSQAGRRLIARDDVDRGAIGDILQANVTQSKRAAAIVARLRQWTTKTRSARGRQKLNVGIDNVAFLLGPDARRRHIDLAMHTDPANPVVVGDAVEIEQLIFNLARNAVEALQHDGAAGRRRISISTTVSGANVLLEISDNGPGITPAMRGRLFEPFATDKPDGMGLGLALCERIVERMDGRIDIRDNDDAGVTARVVLPLADSPGER